MGMRFTFRIDVMVERIEGKFASRDEIQDQLVSWLEDANASQVDGVGADGMAIYEVCDWEVSGS